MNIFSFVVLLMLFYWIFKYRNIKKIWSNILTMCCILEIFQISGSFLKINNSISISYIEFLMMVLIVISFVFIFSRKLLIDKIFKCEIMLLSVILVSILFALLIPYGGNAISFGMSWDYYVCGFIAKQPVHITLRTFLFLIKILGFCQILYVSKRMFDVNDIVSILRKTINFGKFLIIYGFFEIITKMAGSDFTIRLNINIFGEYEGGYSALKISNNILRMQGFSSEPSYYAMGLFFFLIICFIAKDYIDINRIWTYLAIFLLFFSSSFASLIYFAIYALITLILSEKKNVNMLFIGAVVTCTLILFVLLNEQFSAYFISRIKNTFTVLARVVSGNWRGMPFSSELSRFLSTYDTFIVFLDRWLLGCGLGTVTCFSGVVTILADIGILGFYYYVKLVMCNVKNKKKVAALAIIIFIPNILIGSIAMMYTLVYVPMILLLGGESDDRVIKEKDTILI